MSLESMLAVLSPSEKLAAMEILWRDLTANPAEFVSPDWHGGELACRMAKPSNGPRLPLEEAINDVKDRLNARRAQG